MKPKRYDVAIVGSGLAGIVAANTLARYKVNIALIDENIHLGGQILRTVPERLGTPAIFESDMIRRAGFRLIDNVKKRKISVMNRTVVLGIYPERQLLVEENGRSVFIIQPDVILFATGAREKYLPFKGWTLPGVVSTGAVQVLMKGSGVLFSKEILIGGSGPFLSAVAYDYVKNGGRVLGVLDQAPLSAYLPLLTMGLHHVSKLAEGARYVSKLLYAGVRIRHRTRIVQARGEKYLQEVITVKVDRKGNPLEGSERTINARGLAVGYGFAPNIELPLLAGCELEYDQAKGGWVVKVGDDLQTSTPNVYAAGEITGIAGALKSLNEGDIAALSILRVLGKIGEREFLLHFKRLTKQRSHHLKFGAYLNSLYKTRDTAIHQIPDETVICRCEDVTMGEIRRAIREGYHTPGAIKKLTRTGMGRCQGRTCGPILYDIISAHTGKPSADISLLSVRPPIKPVTFDSVIRLSA
jgi:NADPH-dependent 2,4-dienoyl-CoA reductase/sulfur reductase-like enzyme/bacterioferritin-associated ferredoxin